MRRYASVSEYWEKREYFSVKYFRCQRRQRLFGTTPAQEKWNLCTFCATDYGARITDNDQIDRRTASIRTGNRMTC